jgi:carbamoyl-phosphate synthase large subunit
VKNLTLAVSGLHRGNNPQPGSGIIRSLRRAYPQARIIGLVYDVMESGIYAEDGPDEVCLMPYPTVGTAAFFQRLDTLLETERIDLLIPSLDAEIEILARVKSELARRDIRVCLPEIESLRRRAKQFLPQLAETCGITVPETRAAHDIFSASEAASQLGFPLMVKGAYYDARMAGDPSRVRAIAAHLLAEWGAPVILQRYVFGPEFNVLGLGDGAGGILAQCSLRKTVLSDQGKGMGGITINDERLTRLCAQLVRELRWHGPFEIEWIFDQDRDEYVLIEINPRFPAWIDFPSMLGANFAAALVELTLTGRIETPPPPCAPGSFFLRHQIEVVGNVGQYASLLQGTSLPLDPLSDDPFSSTQPTPELRS